MDVNFTLCLGTAVIPLLIGFIWYHPAVFGKAWMGLAGLDEEKLKAGNMALIFGFCILLSLILASYMPGQVIHQMALQSMMMNEPNMMTDPMANPDYHMMITKYGHTFRTFKHGAFHGALSAVFFALPILGINALFERKGAKYIFLHLGYWIITLALMGGVICQWA